MTTGGRGPLVGLVLLVLVLEVPGQQLGLLLLAGVDQADVGAELGREQLDHVVGQRLGGRDHLALQEQEADDVAGAAVELGPEVAGRRAALDDDLAVGHRAPSRAGTWSAGSARAPRGCDGAGGPGAGAAAGPACRRVHPAGGAPAGRARAGAAAEAAATGGTAAEAAAADGPPGPPRTAGAASGRPPVRGG